MLQSEELISRFERLMKTNNDEEFSPFSNEEFNERIDESIEDSKNDRITESDELFSEIKKWQQKFF